MNYLSDSDIDFITKEISNSAIVSSDLKEDLIDHFCCVAEDEMRNGKKFKEAYKKAFQNICPNGFEEIQKETVFLLTKKRIKIMKKSIYLLGFLTLISFTTGALIKLMHWPGGHLLLLMSSIILLLAFLPALFIFLYKKEMSKVFSNKLKYILGYAGFSLLILSVLFKWMHWPGAAFILVLSIVILNFGFLPLLFFKMYKKSA
ncbi:MAG: hypothetical protein K8R54_06790 [Bacteroidales bacterium]|nr:hypothetical protein [Bacteroidales bacterium]